MDDNSNGSGHIMTQAEIQRVEQALSIKLPPEYCDLLIHYPFSEDSFATTCMVIRDAEALIKASRGPTSHASLHHREGSWVPEKKRFLIGNDGGEEEYYLDLEDPRHPVLKFDMEAGIADYKSKIIEIDREMDEDERRAREKRRTAKWWQFWKWL